MMGPLEVLIVHGRPDLVIDVLNVEAVRERFGVSRTVVRETLRTLGALGLVRAKSKVGTQVNPSSSWALLNPAVI